MTLPPITAKQQAILKLVYRYRFIDRIQIQALIGHKDKKRIGTWLKDLRHKQYLGWIYDSTSPANKTTPAIYYLALNGVRYLRTTNQQPPEELGKRYRESSRQPAYDSDPPDTLLKERFGTELVAPHKRTEGRPRPKIVESYGGMYGAGRSNASMPGYRTISAYCDKVRTSSSPPSPLT